MGPLSLRETLIPNGVGVEIGVQEGIFANAVLTNREDTSTYHLVDIDMSRCKVTDPRAIMIELPSVQAAKRFDDNSLDWIYIDAEHGYESVRDDLRAWYPKVKPGGLVLGHDYFFSGSRRVHAQLAIDRFARSVGVMPRFNTEPFPSFWFWKPTAHPRTCIVTACSKSYPCYSTTVANRNAYGFGVIPLPEGLSKADYCWSKFQALQYVANNSRLQYEWLIWMDADAIITDMTRPQSHLVNGSPYDMIVPHDPIGGLNAGVFAIRTSKLQEIFHEWHSYRNDTDPAHDTTALQKLVSGGRHKIEVVHHRLCNSLPEYDLWGSGDWVAHFPGSVTLAQSCSNFWSLTNDR